MIRIRPKLIFIVMVICACSSLDRGQVVPTQTLLEPKLTATPIPDTPTATFTLLPRLQDLLTATPVASFSPVPSSSLSPVTQLDPVASELVVLAQQRLSEELNLPTRRIRLASVAPYIWSDTSLGCPLSGEIYYAASIDGYRIVLVVDDNEYIFHTDFDRIITCEIANEKLPSADSS